MSKAGKKAKAVREKREISELLALQAEYLQEIGEKFAEAGNVTDVGEKIMTLEALKHSARSASVSVTIERENIAKRRAYEATHGIRMWKLVNPVAEFDKYYEIAMQMFVQNPALLAFRTTMGDQETRAAKMLEEAIKTCDPVALARSPRCDEVLKNDEQLRKRFFVAAAKTILENQPKPTTVRKPPTASI
jgi:hypothetical protein